MMKVFILILMIGVLPLEISSQVVSNKSSRGSNQEIVTCDNFVITSKVYFPYQAFPHPFLNQQVINEFGFGFVMATWEDIKGITNFDTWIRCMNLSNSNNDWFHVYPFGAPETEDSGFSIDQEYVYYFIEYRPNNEILVPKMMNVTTFYLDRHHDLYLIKSIQKIRGKIIGIRESIPSQNYKSTLKKRKY